MLLSNNPRIELLHGDCMELMRNTPDKYYELAIVDPPYGINYNYMGGRGGKSTWKAHERKDWDKQTPDKKYFQELFRVSKNQIIWGANYFTHFLPPSMGWIFWDKNKYNFSTSDGELAFTSFQNKLSVFTRMANQDKGFMNKEGGDIHPTQKPTKLYEWLLDKYATCKACNNTGGYYEDVVGDGGSKMFFDCDNCEGGNVKILDTHLGSGSSAIAAYRKGFDFTGIEIDKEYYDAAVKRFLREQNRWSGMDSPIKDDNDYDNIGGLFNEAI